MTRVVIKGKTTPTRHKGRLTSKVSVTSKSTGQSLYLNEEETGFKPVTGTHVAYLRDVVSVKVTTSYNSCGVEIGAEVPFPCKPGDLQSVHKNMDRLSALIEKRLAGKMRELKKVLQTLGGG